MFTCNITLKLKKDAVKDFNRLVETEVLPMLRRENGFRDEIICIAPERQEALAISFWDTKETAEAYLKTGYPNALKNLATVVEGYSKPEIFELALSTLHRLTAIA